MGNNAAFIPQWWETMKQGLRDWKQRSYYASMMGNYEATTKRWETIKLLCLKNGKLLSKD